MEATCGNCGNTVPYGLSCYYVDEKNGYAEKVTCKMCYVRHLQKYYPHATQIIAYEVARMESYGVDVSEFLVYQQNLL
jgi:hypothetical protein